MLTTSAPESRLNLGDTCRLQFEGYQQGKIWSQIEFCQVFTFQMKADGLLQIAHSFIQRLTLGDHSDILSSADGNSKLLIGQLNKRQIAQ